MVKNVSLKLKELYVRKNWRIKLVSLEILSGQKEPAKKPSEEKIQETLVGTMFKTPTLPTRPKQINAKYIHEPVKLVTALRQTLFTKLIGIKCSKTN